MSKKIWSALAGGVRALWVSEHLPWRMHILYFFSISYCRVSKKQKVCGIRIPMKKMSENFVMNSTLVLGMLLLQKSHFYTFQPVLVCST